MSECMQTLRKAVEDFNAKELDRNGFRDRVLETLADNLEGDFSDKDLTIILNLLDKMREQGIADTESCEELAAHFSAMQREREEGVRSGSDFGFESSGRPQEQARSMAGPASMQPPAPGPGFPYPPGHLQPGHPAGLARTLGQLTTLYTWFMAFGAPLSLIPVLNIIGSLLLLTAFVLGVILLFSYWHYLQDGQARTTPLKAVGFHFIPLFQLYWYFVSFWGLAQDMATYARERAPEVRGPNPTIALWFCLLMLMGALVSGAMAWSLATNQDIATMEDFYEVMVHSEEIMGLQMLSGLVSLAAYIVSIFMFRDFTRAMTGVLARGTFRPGPRYSHLAILMACFIGVIFLLSMVAVVVVAAYMGQAQGMG